jgi:hypothetical protein
LAIGLQCEHLRLKSSSSSRARVFRPIIHFTSVEKMAELSQHADKILQSLNGCEIQEVPRLVKAHAASKIQQMLEVFHSLSKESWAAENAPRLELMASTIVEELVSHAAFYGKNGASFEGDARCV